MWKKYAPYALAIIAVTVILLGITLLVAITYGAVAGIDGATGMFRAPLLFRTATDALFFAGGIVLTFGALVEFFYKGFSHALARKIMLPLSRVANIDAPGASDPRSGGWMLIITGAILIIISAVIAITTMK